MTKKNSLHQRIKDQNAKKNELKKIKNVQKNENPGYPYKYPESLAGGKWTYPSGGS